MSKTLDDVKETLTALDAKIDDQIAQTASLIVAIQSLLAKVPPSVDYQQEVDALSAMAAKLASDDPAVQAAIDKTK